MEGTNLQICSATPWNCPSTNTQIYLGLHLKRKEKMHIVLNGEKQSKLTTFAVIYEACPHIYDV